MLPILAAQLTQLHLSEVPWQGTIMAAHFITQQRDEAAMQYVDIHLNQSAALFEIERAPSTLASAALEYIAEDMSSLFAARLATGQFRFQGCCPQP